MAKQIYFPPSCLEVYDGCLEGVWEVFGVVWVTFEMSGGYNVQAIDKKLTRTYFHQLVPRLLVASDWPKCAIFWGVCRVSGRCLEGIWKVSE